MEVTRSEFFWTQTLVKSENKLSRDRTRATDRVLQLETTPSTTPKKEKTHHLTARRSCAIRGPRIALVSSAAWEDWWRDRRDVSEDDDEPLPPEFSGPLLPKLGFLGD